MSRIRRVSLRSGLALMLIVGAWPMERANAGSHLVPFFVSSSDERRESFVRIINRSLEGSEVQIVATDDSGW